MLVYQNAMATATSSPMLDASAAWVQGDGSLNVTSDNPTMGLREVPATIRNRTLSRSARARLRCGTETAAGTAFVEIRRTDQSGIQPTTTDQHQMQVPISQA